MHELMHKPLHKLMYKSVCKLAVLAVGFYHLTPVVLANDTVLPSANTDSKASKSELDDKRLFFSVSERLQPAAAELVDAPVPKLEAPEVKSLDTLEVSEPIVSFQAIVQAGDKTRYIINGLPCEPSAQITNQDRRAGEDINCTASALPGIQIRLLSDGRSLEVTGSTGLLGVLRPGESL